MYYNGVDVVALFSDGTLVPATKNGYTRGLVSQFITAKFADGYECDTELPNSLLNDNGTLKTQTVLVPKDKKRARKKTPKGVKARKATGLLCMRVCISHL